MATVAVTCIKNGRTDSFGRPLIAGTYYPDVEINTANALWNAGYVSVADASVFDQDPLAGTNPLDDFNVARALALTRQPVQTGENLAAELAAIGNPHIKNAMLAVSYGLPIQIVAFGDSTGDGPTEWCYALAAALATANPSHTVDYRLFNDTTQQYDVPVRLQVGTNGAAGVSTGLQTSGYRFSIPDSASTSPTGDIDVRAKLNLGGSIPSADISAFNKYKSGGNISWSLEVKNTGALVLTTTPNGTSAIIRTSTAVMSGALLSSDIWIRATLDVDNGATGNTGTFYTSIDDGATWVQLGSPVVNAGTTSVYDGIATTQFIGRNDGGHLAQQTTAISFYAAKAFASLDGSARFVDIDLSDAPLRTTLTTQYFYDACGNLVTQLGSNNSTRFGSPRVLISNGSVGGTGINYAYDETRFPKLFIGTPAIAIINHGHNVNSVLDYRAEYKTLTDKIIAQNPSACIVAMTQNKRGPTATYYYEHIDRMRQIASFAGFSGFPLIDIFTEMGDGYTIPADPIHPTQEGCDIWSSIVRRDFGV